MAKQVNNSIATEIRRFLTANPFLPFDVKTADGDTFHVFHPDYMMISPLQDTALVYDKDASSRMINLRMVVSAETTRPKKGVLGQGGGKR